ncbi:MAG: hypothetical protein GWP07_05490 [Xanthomonadaceae bacterium]|nr:hypothetical protein [Xanthomonadaceae bacterium]
MGRIKTLLCITIILVFGMVTTAMASTFLFQPEPTSLSVVEGNGTINWSGLFASIDQYKPASHRGFYTHTLDATPGGSSTGGLSGGSFFAGQGLSLDSGGNLSGIGQHRNGKVSAVVAALAGFIGADRLDGFIPHSDRHLSFNTYGETCSPALVPLPGSWWFLFSGFGTLLASRRWWRR